MFTLDKILQYFVNYSFSCCILVNQEVKFDFKAKLC